MPKYFDNERFTLIFAVLALYEVLFCSNTTEGIKKFIEWFGGPFSVLQEKPGLDAQQFQLIIDSFSDVCSGV